MSATDSIATKKMLVKSFPKIDNIRAIPIPFPEYPALITANVYALGDRPITLIDAGPNLPGSLEFIHNELKSYGLDINDVNRILITHGHEDHFGLVGTMRAIFRHPIECFVHFADKWRLSTKNFQEEIWPEGLDNLFCMAGVPEKEVQLMRKHLSQLKQLASPVDDALVMEDGDEFAGEGYRIRVIHTPGHTPGSCCLYDAERKVLFSGDHIIKHTTPNPLVEVKRDSLRDREYQSLEKFLSSLAKVAELKIDSVFPGHGEYIDDLASIISGYIIHHQERMELVWKALRKEMRPIYNIIGDVFSCVPEGDTFLAVSEIFAHLEVLINGGRAVLFDKGPPTLFKALAK